MLACPKAPTEEVPPCEGSKCCPTDPKASKRPLAVRPSTMPSTPASSRGGNGTPGSERRMSSSSSQKAPAPPPYSSEVTNGGEDPLMASSESSDGRGDHHQASHKPWNA